MILDELKADINRGRINKGGARELLEALQDNAAQTIETLYDAGVDLDRLTAKLHNYPAVKSLYKRALENSPRKPTNDKRYYEPTYYTHFS